MKNKLTILLLGTLFLFAGFLYFYKINSIPNGVYSDEATVGYNAFSILKTGKDEYGKSFPVAFRFFGAYTPPLYVYLIVPLIKIFGLNEFSLRSLSAVATLLGIFIVYLFCKSLKLFRSPAIPLAAAFIYATSPWVIFNARLGYEVTLGYILFSLGALLLWRGINGKYLSYWGLAALSVSTYVAHTERFLVPIFLITIFLLFYKEFVSILNKKNIITSFAILFITQIPNFFLLTTNAFWVKNTVYSGAKLSQIIIDFTSQYLTYLSPSELCGCRRDIILQHTIPLLSSFYSWLIIPFFIGLYDLYLKKNTQGGKFLIALFFLSPLPGALSGHFISIQRVLTLIIPTIVVIALGFDYLIPKIKSIVLIPSIIILSLFSILLLWRSYFVFLPQERAVWWSYGYGQLTNITAKNPNTKYVLDNSRLSPVYMSVLYHLQFSPQEFQKQFSPEFVNMYYSNPPYNSKYQIGNIDIRPIVWETDPITSNEVLVGDSLTISDGQAKEHFLDKVFDIKDSFGTTILAGYKTNPSEKIADNAKKTAVEKLLKNKK